MPNAAPVGEMACPFLSYFLGDLLLAVLVCELKAQSETTPRAPLAPYPLRLVRRVGNDDMKMCGLVSIINAAFIVVRWYSK